MSKSAPSPIPGVNMMTDTYDFFKNMWSNVPGMNLPGMNIPGMVMPTLSLDEIDKQIKDLKAVESWLALNMNMLQGTIQALEVQRATISTLTTMGESFTAAMQPKPEISGKSPFESPFAQAASERKSTKKMVVEEPAVEDEEDEDEPAASQNAAAVPSAAEAALIPPLANPAAWWGMLQDQFKQAVNTAAAMTPEAPAAAPESKPAPARKRKAAPK